MAIPRPALRCNFAENPGYLDPRFAPIRSGVATYMDVDGLMKTAPANQLRWYYHPITRQCQGLLLEPSRTNLLWYSRDLTQAQWTKSAVTITANSANAADGTAALDLATVTAPGGYVSQAATITAGHMVAVSVYARAAATGWLSVALTDGINFAYAWFNLTTGVKGANTAGGGQVLYSRHDIEDMGGGLYRCVLTVTTTVTTAVSAVVLPCAANSASSATSDAAHLGDFQLETASGTLLDATSPITTAGATAARSSDGLTIPTSLLPGFNTGEGTFLLEGIYRRPVLNSNVLIGGIGDTFANTVYSTFDGITVYCTAVTATVSQAQPSRGLTGVVGSRFRIAFRWASNNFALCVNGGTLATDVSGTVPPVVRVGIGTSPWATSGGGPCHPLTLFALFPQALTDAEMQSITLPSPV